MTSNGDKDICFHELNKDVKEEYDRGENGVLGYAHGPGSVRDGDLRIDKVDEDVTDGRGKFLQGQFVVQTPQLQPQGSMVHWERFLHVRSIKVMLVENDDSTRHIVTALLRNCNYEVIEAANGLQAWKILEDPAIHVDIVLTEVSMPLLSGVNLLCKIMSHNTRKNIPIIMMSSHDSMGLVFKCLSKGAVDFLVKPIRKNELKNLWQHVWRRCHSSSGSGSESGTRTQKSVKSKSSARSDRNSDCNDGDDDENNGLDSGDGSDDGSGTQSSWTKQAVEVDSPRAASQWDQKAECQYSTCGQVILSNVEAPGIRDIHGQEQVDKVAKGKELVIGKSIHSRGGECSSHKQKANGCSNMSDRQKDDRELEALREPANLEIKNNIHDDPIEGETLELSLKRLREVKDTDGAVQYDRNVLRHSELSAFSRYNTTAKAYSDPSGITRSSSQLNNRSDVTKKESMQDFRSHSDGYINQTSNINNMDVGSATDMFHMNPFILKDKSEVTFTVNCLHSSSAFRPIKTEIKSSSQQVGSAKTNETTKMPPNGILDPPRDPHHELPVQHIHHHHHVHHYHNIDGGDQSLSNPDDLSLKKLAADAQYCGSSNLLSVPVLECIPGNYSLNRSASGSKHGSNGQNGSSTAVNAGGYMESVVEVAPKNGNGDDSGSGSRNEIDQRKSRQREAALAKFRQKRIERCFQKKVRYQNRKKLAEQRPRVRGQFVKQTGNTDNSSSAADS